jgi:thymidylate synthase
MRSNDAYKAGYMNMFAFTDLQRVMAEKISEKLGREIAVGAYTHVADSFHIYGSYFNEFEQFLISVRDRKFEDRVWDTSFALSFFEEGRKKLEAEKAENK